MPGYKSELVSWDIPWWANPSERKTGNTLNFRKWRSYKPLNQFLDTLKRGLLAWILPLRKEHGQIETSGTLELGWCTAHVIGMRKENAVGQQLKRRGWERRTNSQKASSQKRWEEWKGRFPRVGRGVGTHHNSCNLGMILALGLKKMKVFPSVPLNVIHSLEVGKMNDSISYSSNS